MIKAKFTPAPWFIEEETDGKPPNETKYYWVNAEDHAPIDNEWAVMKEADAHLIAAAPELYEALKAVLEILPIGFAPTGRPGGADERNASLDAIRANAINVLAKARGES